MDAERMRKNLLTLCAVPSVSHTAGERAFPAALRKMLMQIPYFRAHPDAVRVLPVSERSEDGEMVFALLRAGAHVRRTVMLLSHFDVVGVDEYGALAQAAFDPEAYTRRLRAGELRLPDAAREDLQSGNYLFGRGVCDMKWGIAADVELLYAFSQAPDAPACNLLLVSVPDEERNSCGMIGAVKYLERYAQENGLDLAACVVSEPNISPERDDAVRVLHVGTAGKLMPAVYCFGKETHVGEPFSGLNADLLCAAVTQEVELNPAFADVSQGVCTPAPCCLKQGDLKEAYSVQTPCAAYAYYNVITAQSTPAQVMERMRAAAERAFERVLAEVSSRRAAYARLSGQTVSGTDFRPRVWTYAQLCDACRAAHGEAFDREMAAFVRAHADADVREASIAAVAHAHGMLPDREPLIVLFCCPPYYPHAPAAEAGSLVRRACERLCERGAQMGERLRIDPCFMGLSDMSYLSLGRDVDVQALAACFPVWGALYGLPLEQMRRLNIPFVNFGPLGKDAHRYTERVDLAYSFGKAPALLRDLVFLLAQG